VEPNPFSIIFVVIIRSVRKSLWSNFMNTVATTRIFSDTTTSVDVGDEVGAIQLPSLDERVRGLLEKEKPITAWKAAAKLGVGYINQVSAVLDGLTTEGSLATFKVGFNKYYALPKVA
jgi:hypothetical protein